MRSRGSEAGPRGRRKLGPRARKWLTLAVVLLFALPAPIVLVLGLARVRTPPRRVLPFEPSIWRAETARLEPGSARGLMLPGLLASGRLAGLTAPEARALLGEPDCQAGPGGPFAGPRLAYWVGKVGTRPEREGAPPAGPACLHLRLEGGRVVEWRVVPAALPAPRARPDRAGPTAPGPHRKAPYRS